MESIRQETVAGEHFLHWKEQEWLLRKQIPEEQQEQLVTETTMPEQSQALDSQRRREPTEPSPNLGEHLLANNLERDERLESAQRRALQVIEAAEVEEAGQEGMTPEQIRLEVLRRIQMLVQDDEIYREFQLYLDERSVERQKQLEQRHLLHQQAQVVDVDSCEEHLLSE